ncbi:monocarboxylate transporter 12-like isoform X2 [Adelges cooleyi]|nr:monocarboxylate transporter 12-like isoform X2 [Adelges cooleyi]XP_050428934.1 monocarboxylate transporter 12-like isoform X2 [Adelges cooleyi]
MLVGPDGDWGWYVVGGCAFVNFLLVGMLRTYGPNVLEQFVEKNQLGYDKDYGAGWIPSTFNLAFYLAGPLGCILCEPSSHRAITVWGGLLASTGMFLSSFANSVPYLYLSYGVMVGFGAGLCYPAGILIVIQYFNKQRGLAVGLSMAGTTAGSIIMPTYINYLTKSYGCRGAVLITAGIMLNVIACALIYHPVNEYGYPVDVRTLAAEEVWPPPVHTPCTFCCRLKSAFVKNRKRNRYVRKQNFSLVELCVKPQFFVVTLTNAVYCLAHSVFQASALPADSESYPSETLAFLVFSVADLVARITVPALLDHLPLNASVYSISALGIGGVVLSTVHVCREYIHYAFAYMFAFGLASGTFFTMQTLLMIDLLGHERLAATYATTLLAEGIAQLSARQFFSQSQWFPVMYSSLGANLILLSVVWTFLLLFATKFTRQSNW